MERCIAAFAEKITWHQQFPRRAEVGGERSLASIILKAAAEMYDARRTPAAGSVSSAGGFTLYVSQLRENTNMQNMHWWEVEVRVNRQKMIFQSFERRLE